MKTKYFQIYITFLFAILLSIIALPTWLETLRPQWVALVLIYWCIALPEKVGIFHAFILGLLLDVTLGGLLGVHALTLSIIAFLATNLHARLRVFPVGQQMIIVLFLLTLEISINGIIMGFIGQNQLALSYWFVPLIGALIWPWVFIVLRKVRRKYKVI